MGIKFETKTSRSTVRKYFIPLFCVYDPVEAMCDPYGVCL